MPDNSVFWLQVLHFVVSHVDVFISILQDRQAVHSSGSLQELGLVTGIVCNMGLTEVTLTTDGELGQEQLQLRGPLARIQRLMIGLLRRYCSSENWEKVNWVSLTFDLFQWLPKDVFRPPKPNNTTALSNCKFQGKVFLLIFLCH